MCGLVHRHQWLTSFPCGIHVKYGAMDQVQSSSDIYCESPGLAMFVVRCYGQKPVLSHYAAGVLLPKAHAYAHHLD